MKKGAVQLSVNFLVIIIVSMAILSMGIVLTRKIFEGTDEMRIQLDRQTIAQLENMLDDGSILVAPLNKKIAERKGPTIFGVGVRNIDINPKTIYLFVQARDVDGCQSDIDWVLTRDAVLNPPDKIIVTREIPANKKESYGVGIVVPKNTKPCTYVFGISAAIDNPDYPISSSDKYKSYGPPDRLYVTVE